MLNLHPDGVKLLDELKIFNYTLFVLHITLIVLILIYAIRSPQLKLLRILNFDDIS